MGNSGKNRTLYAAALAPAKKAPKAKKPAKPATHPQFTEMTTAANTNLKENSPLYLLITLFLLLVLNSLEV